MVVVRKELEQTLPKTACPGHAVVGKVCLVTSPKTVFVCIWLLLIVCSSIARSLGWPCPRQHAKGMPSRVRCSEIPNLVCSSERSWFLANSVIDVYGCSTHLEQEKGCPYPALATPQLRSTTAIPFGISKHPLPTRSLRFLRVGVRSTSFAVWMHHAHPFVAAAGKTCLMQRSKGFGHGVVVSKICYNAVIVLSVEQWDCCKPTNTCRDWAFSNTGLEVRLPAFQLPMFEKWDSLPKRDLLDMFV